MKIMQMMRKNQKMKNSNDTRYVKKRFLTFEYQYCDEYEDDDYDNGDEDQ